MSRKIAIKRLRPSDLSFFHAYLREHPKAKQKSFNLDRTVIEERFFPALSEIAAARPRGQIPIQLTLYGPGGAGGHTLMRKILKQEKNWRLNGEVVHDPDDQPGRYSNVAPDDFALMEFAGSGEPSAIKIVLLSGSDRADAVLHQAISSGFPGGSMWVPTVGELEKIIDAASPSADHPVRDWLDDSLIEDVGFGGGGAAIRLARRRRSRGLSHAELQQAKLSAETTGHRGEELLNHYLTHTPWAGVTGHRWVARENAVAPYDFELDTGAGTRFLDAKSTAGDFNNELHMSLGEIYQAVHGGVPYDIARLYELREGWAKFKVASGVGSKLVPVLTHLEGLPPEVKPDSLAIKPEFFEFDAVERVAEIPDDPQ